MREFNWETMRHMHRIDVCIQAPSSLCTLFRTAVLRFQHAVAVRGAVRCSSGKKDKVASNKKEPFVETMGKLRASVERETSNPRKKLEKLWSSSKDVNIRVALLLQMARAASETKFLLPRQVRILPACISFWTKNFPNCDKVLPKEIVQGLNNPCSSNPESFSLLSRTLMGIYGANSKFAAIADVSVAAGEVSISSQRAIDQD